MKTKNNPSKRQENIINYLNEHGKVSTAILKSKFDIKRSTLSEDIKYLRSKGYPLVTEHNYISLAQTDSDIPAVYHEKLSHEFIRKWIILYAINYYIYSTDSLIGHTEIEYICASIYHALSPDISCMSDQVFEKDIRELMALGYIAYSYDTKELLDSYKILRKEQKTYVATDKLSKIVMLDEHEANMLSVIFNTEPYDSIYRDMYERMLRLYSDKINGIPQTNHNSQSYSALETITKLLKHPFMDTCLKLTCTSESLPQKQIIYNDFETGIILFSSETNRFYLLGKATTNDSPQKMYYMVPVDSIAEIETLFTTNSLYKKPEIATAYSQLLSTTLNNGMLKPIAVDFIIINTPQNNNFCDFARRRRWKICDCSEVQYIAFYKPELTMNYDKVKQHGLLRYKDTILGYADLMRLINRFGDELQILEPKSLINDVEQERQKWKSRYEETFAKEYKENINECL